VNLAFSEWAQALARDADAALGFAQAYRDLEAAARSALLDALDEEIAAHRLPVESVYAPVLAVELEADEQDAGRRARALEALSQAKRPPARTTALRGSDPDGVSVLCLVRPAYLGFVGVLVAGLRARHIIWAEGDLLREVQRAPCDGDVLRGATLRDADAKSAIEELAHAVVATARAGRTMPPLLHAFADLFSMPALLR
jgi:hypothetical protein